MITSNPNCPTFKFDSLPLEWQMTRCEKFAFQALVEFVKPQIAIEIGTYRGGSLQILAQHASSVYSIDIDPKCREVLQPQFNNVEFLTGTSRSILPDLLEKLSLSDRDLEFVLIDGEHTTEAVRDDINGILKYTPKKPMYIVFHDSFNPACRKGILAADWAACPFVHFVEVDFIPGVYHHEGFDHAEPRSMYGGLAVALLQPNPREHELILHQSQKGLFEVLLRNSCHSKAPLSMVSNLSRKVLRKVLR